MKQTKTPRRREHFHRLSPALAGALLLAPLLLATPATGAVVPLEAESMVRLASDIVVARVLSKAVRWNDRHNLIVTDYKVVVEQRLKGTAGKRLTLTVAGGTLDGETHETSISTHLEVGARYVLFLDDLESPGQTPFTGGWQGVVRERFDDTGLGRPVGGSDGLRRIGDPETTFTELVERLRLYVEDVEATPPAEQDAAGSGTQRLPAKTFVPGPPLVAGNLEVTPLTKPTDAPPEPDTAPRALASGTAFASAGASPAVDTKFYISRWPALPVVFNPFPLYWYWSPHDQYMMSKWNFYREYLFMVYLPPSDTWAWGNDVFELAGWPSNSDMIDQFGSGWESGELAVTYYRWTSGPIVEADIALNPAYSWTLDNEYALRESTSVVGFEHTMLHELGHSFGLKHPWEAQDVWWDSVMNYPLKKYRFPFVHTDDANAVRFVYPGTSIHDGLLTFYQTRDKPSSSRADYEDGYLSSPNIVPGNSFFIYDLMLENVGTDNLVNPTIEIYLTPNRMDWTGYIYLDSVTFYQTIGTFTTLYFDLFSIPLPKGTPPGSYYVAIYFQDGSDGYLPNNSAWPNHLVQLTVAAVPDLSIPSVTVLPSAMTPLQSCSIDARVDNDGNVAANATTLRYYLSTDSTISVDDTQIATDAVASLASGASVYANAGRTVRSSTGPTGSVPASTRSPASSTSRTTAPPASRSR